MPNVLFVCSQNRLRSPTAEQIFADWPDVNAASAGLNSDAESPVTAELVSWARIIFVMEKTHRNKLRKKFRAQITDQRVICLHIPDEYDYMDPALIQLLKNRVSPYLPG